MGTRSTGSKLILDACKSRDTFKWHIHKYSVPFQGFSTLATLIGPPLDNVGSGPAPVRMLPCSLKRVPFHPSQLYPASALNTRGWPPY